MSSQLVSRAFMMWTIAVLAGAGASLTTCRIHAGELPAMPEGSSLLPVREHFESEVRDDAWAEVQEVEIRNVLQDSTIISLPTGSASVTCHTTICRVLIENLDRIDDSNGGLFDLFNAIHLLEGLNAMRTVHIHREEGLVELYYSRSGFQINGELRPQERIVR